MRWRLLVACGVGLGVLAGGAQAETLDEALVETYNGNPQILAERALLRSTDENVPQALAGWRPTVQFTGSAGVQQLNTGSELTFLNGVIPGLFFPSQINQITHPRQTDLNVTENLYQGGRTIALTAQAEDTVRAERARAIATEAAVFFSVTQAYLDVLRDQDMVKLNINNEQVLRRQLEMTDEQFRVGSVTRTDVAQAEARLAAATASRLQAEGTLETSRAEYVRAVGHPPEDLVTPKLRPALPANRDDALALAARQNPNVVAAIFSEDAARDAVVATRAQLLPKVSVTGDFAKQLDTEYSGYRATEDSVIAQVTVPLYEGGAVYSQTRQAEETVGQRKSQTDDARRAALQSATQAWETIRTARASIVSLKSTIRAAEISVEGTREEQQVGSRTVIDVLNAEQELFTDQVNLVQAEHDLAVAEFNLAQQIGRLTALDLTLPVKLYDADTHYKAVRDKWIGFEPQP